MGAAGGIGQPLALLMKNCNLVSQLNCYDLAPFTMGVAADLSHIETPAKVKGFMGPENLAAALKGVEVSIKIGIFQFGYIYWLFLDKLISFICKIKKLIRYLGVKLNSSNNW